MTTFEIAVVVILSCVLLVVVWLITEFSSMKSAIRERTGINNETVKLQLQAYERLTLLTERIALHNVISRHPSTGLSAREMKNVLIESMRSEFDYNLSQQIYVTADAWRAVTNLKEQNIYLVNQIAASLPPQATGMDLNKHIIDFLMNSQKGNLNTVVAEVINFEAKKVM
jgi:hypothetical protein